MGAAQATVDGLVAVAVEDGGGVAEAATVGRAEVAVAEAVGAVLHPAAERGVDLRLARHADVGAVMTGVRVRLAAPVGDVAMVVVRGDGASVERPAIWIGGGRRSEEYEEEKRASHGVPRTVAAA